MIIKTALNNREIVTAIWIVIISLHCQERIQAKKPAVRSGNKFSSLIVAAKVSAILGKSIKRPFPKRCALLLAKKVGGPYVIERWHNVLRQSNARFACKTLPFSKSDAMHEIACRSFVV